MLLPPRRLGILRLLSVASWLLLLVTWVMSVYAYSRLPQDMALWKSFWVKDVLWTKKSPVFFVYPVAQTVIFFAIWSLARAFFFQMSGLEKEKPASSRDEEVEVRLLDLKKETISLVLIFFNLILIHLQTSLVLLSHRLVSGINLFYVGMLFAVLLILIPYYAVRRRMLLRALY